MANKLTVILGLNTAGFTNSLDSAKSQLGKFAMSLGRSMFGQFLGAHAVIRIFRSIGSAIKGIIEEAKEISNLQQIFGGNAEYVQKMRYAAEDANISLGEMRATFGSLSKAMERAKDGSIAQIKAFSHFGIASSEIKSLSLHEVFERVRTALRLMSKETGVSQETLANLKTLGFLAAQVPMLLKDLDTYNVSVVSDEEIEKLDKIDAKITALKRLAKMVFVDIAIFWVEMIDSMSKADIKLLKTLSMAIDGIFRPVTRIIEYIEDAYSGKGEELPENVSPRMREMAEQKRLEREARAKRQLEEERTRALQEADRAARDAAKKIVDGIEDQIRAEQRRNAPIHARLSMLREELDLVNTIAEQAEVITTADKAGNEEQIAKARLKALQLEREIANTESKRSPLDIFKETEQRKKSLQNQIEQAKQEIKRYRQSIQSDVNLGNISTEEGRKLSQSVYTNMREGIKSLQRELSNTTVIQESAISQLGKEDIETLRSEKREIENEIASGKKIGLDTTNLEQALFGITSQLSMTVGQLLGKGGLGERSPIDSLAKIGGFVGGAVANNSPIVSVGKEQLKVQQDMRKQLGDLNQNVAKLNPTSDFLWA